MQGLTIRLTFVLWLLFCSAVAGAEQVRTSFRRITVDQGLSNNYVKTICQDKAGNIWLGTSNGLNKLNGYNIKIYRHDSQDVQTLQSNIINYLYADADGTVWACTADGLSVYDKEEDVFRRLDIPDVHSVENIIQLAPQHYLVSTRNFSLYLNRETGRVRRFLLDGRQVAAFSLCEKDGTILVGTMDKTVESLYFDGENLKRKYSPINVPLNATAVLLRDETHGWVGFSKNEMLSLDFTTGEALPVDTTLPSGELMSAMIYDERGRLWVGTANALFVYDFDTREYIWLNSDPNDPSSLSHNHVRALFRDASGGIWVGTECGGVNYWNGRPSKFNTIKSDTGEIFLGKAVVTTMALDNKETVWIGTRENGLYAYQLNDGRVKNYPIDNIRSLYCPDDAPLVYLGTSVTGWYILNKKTGGVRRHETPSDVNAILEARAGKIWLGSLSGLFLYDPGTGKTVKQIFSSEDGLLRVLTLFTDSRGHLWVGAKECLREYRVSEDNTLEEVTPGNLKDLVYINCMCETAGKYLWIGTADGMFSYDTMLDSLFRIKEVPGLLNTAINGMEGDAHGNLWVSTDSGLTRYSPDTNTGRTFSVKDGLQGNQFSAMSCHFQDGEGRLYFGGVGGVTVLNPDSIVEETRTEAPVLTGLRIRERVISVSDSICLRHNQNSISISFSCPDYVSWGRNRFRYIMEGVDQGWVHARAREVTYANLDKGEYVFRLRVANMDGVWDPREAVLHIKVLPAWYRSALFRFFYILALCLLLIYAEYKLYLRIRKQNDARLAGLSREYEDRLRQFRLLSFVSVPFTLTDGDAALLGTVIDEIDKNLTNPQFSVSFLAESMGITRATLHKRVKAITGHSPVELVRAIRIQKACDLLKEKKCSVADVAEQTGFNSVSYFISSFKQVVGRTPGEY